MSLSASSATVATSSTTALYLTAHYDGRSGDTIYLVCHRDLDDYSEYLHDLRLFPALYDFDDNLYMLGAREVEQVAEWVKEFPDIQ